MIELQLNTLLVSFPELPLCPKLTLSFQRTLRIPDDGSTYPLPPGLGPFPLCHIDDYAQAVPAHWLKRGGVLLPMWQSEALWLRFFSATIPDREVEYPFAVKVAAGKISAITGENWNRGLSRNPQDYLVVPKQPWLDGFCVEKGIIRQFVAMPLGDGYSAEEQLTGKGAHGGLQIEIFPMKHDVFTRRYPVRPPRPDHEIVCRMCDLESPMGLAPGGRMRQEIFEDPYSIHDWDLDHSSRCFIHLVNSAAWQRITGEFPPSQPLTAQEYAQVGLPWFDYYDAEAKALQGSSHLAKLKSVNEKAQELGHQPPSDNQSIPVSKIISLHARLKPTQVREEDLSV